MTTAGKENFNKLSPVAFAFKPVLSSVFECAEKVSLAGFSMYDYVSSSLGPNDVCLLVYKHLFKFSFCTKYSPLPQGVVYGLENSAGESC